MLVGCGILLWLVLGGGCTTVSAPPATGEEQLSLAEALAAAVVDSGASVVTNVPATGVTEVYDAIQRRLGQPPVYSYNEEVAYTVAHGAALAGARSVAVLKSHGFAKAANSVIDSITAGTNAGFVALVFNDRTGRHSDNVFDTVAFVRGTGVIWIQPDPQHAYTEILRAFATSEKLRVPVAVMIESDDLSATVTVRRQAEAPPAIGFKRDIYQHLLCPLLAPHQRRLLEARLAGNPVPTDRPALPVVPDGLPPQFQATVRSYQPVFDAFKQVKGEAAMVAGDAGTASLFAFPPYDSIDITTYYGGSIPLAVGFCLAGRREVWAVTGDFAFIAASHLGLAEAIQRRLPLKVIIFHNRIAAATGGQPIQPDVFETLLGGYQRYVRIISDHTDRAAAARILAEAKASDRLEIIVVEIP